MRRIPLTLHSCFLSSAFALKVCYGYTVLGVPVYTQSYVMDLLCYLLPYVRFTVTGTEEATYNVPGTSMSYDGIMCYVNVILQVQSSNEMLPTGVTVH